MSIYLILCEERAFKYVYRMHKSPINLNFKCLHGFLFNELQKYIQDKDEIQNQRNPMRGNHSRATESLSFLSIQCPMRGRGEGLSSIPAVNCFRQHPTLTCS